MKTFSHFRALLVVASGLLAAPTVQAQSNLGQDCGCPPVASRTTVVLMSSLCTNVTANEADLAATNTILTCDKTYILDKKIYVPSGKSITINPGTVIKGRNLATGNASALIVQRDAKIFASGTPSCQIVFTAEADPLDGTYAVANRGQWGGLVLLGKAQNNLVLGNTYCYQNTGVGFIEGYASGDSRNLYGGIAGATDDDDNSGILRYVSVRHCGDVLAIGNELNGISMGSVGRGTIMDHIEVISSDDDGIEWFGGTVNMKYGIAMFGNDDMFDYDLGWTGKAQFMFGLAADSVTTPTADNGVEADGDDNKSNALPRSHPKFYNMTLIGNRSRNNAADNSAHAALNLKEFTEGEFYNSVFSNFRIGANFIKSTGTRTGGCEAYQNWFTPQIGSCNAGSLLVSNNTFVNNRYAVTTAVSNATAGSGATLGLAADNTKFANDGNVIAASVPGFDFSYTMNTSTNAISDKYNPTPSPVLGNTVTVPNDGFFTPATYRGAFEAGKKSWMSDWSVQTIFRNNVTNALQSITLGLLPCPTDINGDGLTNNVDFLQLLNQFNQNCQ
jgi:hypothetical protein